MLVAALIAVASLFAAQNPPGFPPPASGVPAPVTPRKPQQTGSRWPQVRTVKLATGESASFVFRSGMPEAGESAGIICLQGGPELNRDGTGVRITWAFQFRARRPGMLASVKKVTVDEVSGSEVRPIFSGAPDIDKDLMEVIAPAAELVSKTKDAWLYEEKRTLFVFRFRFEREGGEKETLLQPVMITRDIKSQFRQLGYIH